jgi:hypothetical protein
MRTTLDLPRALLNEALQVSHERTRTAVVITALENLIRKNKLEGLRQFKGKVNLSVNLSALRNRK